MSALGWVFDYVPSDIAPGWLNAGFAYDEWVMTGFPLLEFHRADDGTVEGEDRLEKHA